MLYIPSINIQYPNIKIVLVIKFLGVKKVFEGGLSIDMIVSRDLEKERVCCSAFIKYINIIFNKLVDKI